MMEITVNGGACCFNASLDVSRLLDVLTLTGKRLLAKMNYTPSPD